MAELARLGASGLRALAQAASTTRCPVCTCLDCPGWETLPAGVDDGRLRAVATLRGDDPEPGLDEYHPQGTRLWSPDAPVAPAFFPYNRCEVHACNGCGRLFLRYTEYGGYYVDSRIRELRADFVVEGD